MDASRSITGIGLLSPAQVAELCGLSRRAVYRAIERGELPAARLCHRLRVETGDLDAWLHRSRVETAATTPLPPVRVATAPTTGLRRLLIEEDERERRAS